MIAVRRAFIDDAGAIAGMLARAFVDDPIVCYLLANRTRRIARLERFFGAHLRANFIPRGEVYVTEDLAASALWIPPSLIKANFGHRFSQVFVVLQLGLAAPRMIEFATFVAPFRPHVPHYYLGVIGTNPDRQRAGRASALLDLVLDRCDRDSTLAYLECSNESNISLYTGHGFAVLDEVRFRDSPPIWLMARDPKS